MPTIGEVMDIVRSHLSKTDFPTELLKQAMAGGRREVEKLVDTWWMKETYTKATVPTQQVYSLTTLTNNGWGMTRFKDIRAMFYKESTDTSWDPILVGQENRETLELQYDTDEDGDPESAIIEGDKAIIFPIPDKAFDLRIFIYQWTSNPTGNNESDDLTDQFPEALIYGSLIWAYEIKLKSAEGAAYWRTQLEGPLMRGGSRRGGEISKIKALNLKRGMQNKWDFTPHTGPGRGLRKRLDNRQLYLR